MDSSREAVARVAAWLSAGDVADPWVVETSGSTGAPKRVLLGPRAVRASIDLSARRLGGVGRWLLALPADYVAGFNVISRSLAAGHEPVLLDEHDSFAAAAAATVAGGTPGYCSLVPTRLRRLLDDPASTEALGAFEAVLVGGGPVDPALRERAAAAGVRVVATYGSAETCGGCVYDGVPLDGVGLAIAADGRVRITGPTLFDGYDGDPARTAEVLVDGWFLTSDAGRLDEDGRLQLLGRVDDMVVSGGVNVPAAVVARRLREHPAVAEAEVLGVPDAEWGNRVVAFVVGLDTGARAPYSTSGASGAGAPCSPSGTTGGDGGDFLTLDTLRDWVGQTHPRAWAPRQLVLLDALPLLANGKPDRLALRELAGREAVRQGAAGQQVRREPGERTSA